jgi:hypothetical protein
MATKEQLRKMRQKYHLGEYRLSRKSKVHHHQTKGRRKMAKHKRTSRRRSGMTSGLMANVIGVGGYIAYEAFLSPKIPLSGTAKSVAELAAGIWLGKKSGVVGNIGKAMVVLSAYKLLSGVLSPMLATSSTY